MSAPDAIAAALEQVRSHPHDDAGWLAAFLQLTAARHAALEPMLTARHQLRGDAGSFTYAAGLTLLDQNDAADSLAWMLRQIRRNSAFHGIIQFLAGLQRAAALDLAGCLSLIREGACQSWQCRQDIFTADAAFDAVVLQMLRQSAMLEGADYRPTAPLPTPEQQIIFDPGLADAALPLVVACCDPASFQNNARPFVESLRAACPHAAAMIHFINPLAALSEQAAQLRKDFPRLGLSCEVGPVQTSYAAANRFLLAEQLLDRYRRPLALADISTRFRDDADSILRECSRHPVSIIRQQGHHRLEQRYAPILLGLDDNAEGRGFLADMRGYLAGKLAEPTPLENIEATGLFRAACLAADRGEMLFDLSSRFDLPDDLQGSRFTAHRETQGTPLGAITFDDDGRPIFA